MERGIDFLFQVLGQLEEIDILDDAASMVPEMIDAIVTFYSYVEPRRSAVRPSQVPFTPIAIKFTKLKDKGKLIQLLNHGSIPSIFGYQIYQMMGLATTEKVESGGTVPNEAGQSGIGGISTECP